MTGSGSCIVPSFAYLAVATLWLQMQAGPPGIESLSLLCDLGLLAAWSTFFSAGMKGSLAEMRWMTGVLLPLHVGSTY